MHKWLMVIALTASASLAGWLATAGAAPAMRIAVLEFQRGGSSAGDLDSLGKGLQSMVTTDLSQVQAFQLVERSRLRDIQAELKLARSGEVDKATAVKIGKLAGATHLVAGSFTIVGNQMRLDTRIFDVADGKILLAAKIDGEKDAFFELEKKLVGQLVHAVGVKLAPKERADIGRIHTADFEAFRRYSEGLQLFDDNKYEEALAALREAGSRDQSFKLAVTTLEDYEKVITELRTKADAVAAAQAAVRKLEQDKSVRDVMEMVRKLYDIATQPGDAAQMRRLAALHALAGLYGGYEEMGHEQPHVKLLVVQDDFTLLRTADTLWKRYFSESVQVFPRVPVTPLLRLGAPAPHPATLDDDLAKLIRWFADGTYSPGRSDHTQLLLTYGLAYRALARHLHMDGRQALELGLRLIDLSAKAGADDGYRRGYQQDIARELAGFGDIDKSTTLLRAIGAREDKPYRLKEIAAELEDNRDLAKAAESPLGKVGRELIMFASPGYQRRGLAKRLQTLAKLGADELALLNRGRQFSSTNHEYGSEDYVIVDDMPMWEVRFRQPASLATGPRSDPWRATELRYHGGAGKPANTVVVIDGAPHDGGEAHFEISYVPAPEFAPVTGKLEPGRPEVAFAFGIRDVSSSGRGQYVSDGAPMRSWQVAIGPDAVRFVEAEDHVGALPKLKVLATKPIDLKAAKRVQVTVKIAGSSVSVKVGGAPSGFTASFTVPTPHAGCLGFEFRGTGYAAVTGFKLKAS